MEKEWIVVDWTASWDEEQEYLFGGFETRKEAEEQAKRWRWCDRWLGKHHKYIVVREDEIFNI